MKNKVHPRSIRGKAQASIFRHIIYTLESIMENLRESWLSCLAFFVNLLYLLLPPIWILAGIVRKRQAKRALVMTEKMAEAARAEVMDKIKDEKIPKDI